MADQEEKRPNPEDLLALIKEEERKEAHGKLKIFFGSAPGVGKTHAMLEDAIQKLSEGIDVVVGLVESHGRKEIEALVAQIEQLPRKKVNYHGRIFYEFDLDKALKRRPGLILIDELAHTNQPGSRYAKRWQDVKEILVHDIDVYSTLNVQHLESLNDVITQITGITVRETVPDSVIEEAAVIELIDLPPDDLLLRLQEGKVYAPDQAELAKQNFFNKGNLFALRELALRVTAQHVNAQVLYYRRTEAIQKTWPTTERLLVCITPNERAAKLIRAARRMAKRLQAEWIAVYVEAKKLKLTEVESHHLENAFRLAERLGGETYTLSGRDITEELINFARDRNATKIVIGKEMHSRVKTFFFGSFVDELLRRSGDIDVYVIQGGYEKTHRLLPVINLHLTSRWESYLFACFTIILSTLIGFLISARLELSNLGLIYLLGVILISIRGERGPALLAAFLGIFAFDFFFVPPKYSFLVRDKQYLISFMIVLVVSLVANQLAITGKRKTAIARVREWRANAMYALSRKLANSRGLDEILHNAIQHTSVVFESQVAALLPLENGELEVRVNTGLEFVLDEKEISVARWVYNYGQAAGMGTQTLPFVSALYVPLLGKRQIIGVMRVLPSDPHRLAIPEQLHLLETFANLIATVIEVDRDGSEKVLYAAKQ